MQEILSADLSDQHHNPSAYNSVPMLSVKTTILGRSNEPNEVFRLDVLVIEYVSLYDFLLV